MSSPMPVLAPSDASDEEAAEGLQLLQQELSLSLLATELHHTSALLGELETVLMCDFEILRTHKDEEEGDEGEEEEEDTEAFGPDDSFDHYDDVPLRILRQRMAGECLYYLVQWKSCGTSWVATEDFAYPRVVREFHLRRMGRDKPPAPAAVITVGSYPPPKPKRNPTRLPLVQWGHGANYVDFPWHLEGAHFCTALKWSFQEHIAITRIERWVNPKTQTKFDAAPGGRTILAFHGTPKINLSSIYRRGLCAGGTCGIPVSHGSSFGFGIYVSKTAPIALGHADTKLIACAVRIPYIAPELSAHEYSDTMVIENPTLILPVYLIHVQNIYACAEPVEVPQRRIVQPTARQLKRLRYLKEYAIHQGKR